MIRYTVNMFGTRRLWTRAQRAWRSVSDYEPPSTPLIAATRRGDLAEVRRLLDSGIDPNAQSGRGRTALHDAAAASRSDVAALLLTRGASHEIVDRHGRKPLDPANAPLATLHQVRQHHHRRRTLDASALRDVPAQSRRWAEELAEKGIIKVSGLVGPTLLAQLRDDFNRFVVHLEARLAEGQGVYKHYDEEDHFWKNDRAYVSNNAFKYSDALVRLCCMPELVEAARVYLGRPPHIQRGGAMRYLPSPKADNDMFGWHHDMEEKRFKIQLLLTGVGSAGQRMSFVEGTHQLMHPYAMFFHNECGLDYCRSQMEERPIFDASGQAGDLFIFDSNGAHRGNRSETADVRDVFMIEYTADTSHIWGGDVNPRVLDEVRFPAGSPFDRLMMSPKVWDQPRTRTLSTWADSLPHVERWL